MQWFTEVNDAVNALRSANDLILVVSVEGDVKSENVKLMKTLETSLKDTDNYSKFVGLHVPASSILFKQLCAIYHMIPVPCLFFIRGDGQPIDIIHETWVEAVNLRIVDVVKCANSSVKENLNDQLESSSLKQEAAVTVKEKDVSSTAAQGAENNNPHGNSEDNAEGNNEDNAEDKGEVINSPCQPRLPDGSGDADPWETEDLYIEAPMETAVIEEAFGLDPFWEYEDPPEVDFELHYHEYDEYLSSTTDDEFSSSTTDDEFQEAMGDDLDHSFSPGHGDPEIENCPVCQEMAQDEFFCGVKCSHTSVLRGGYSVEIDNCSVGSNGQELQSVNQSNAYSNVPDDDLPDNWSLQENRFHQPSTSTVSRPARVQFRLPSGESYTHEFPICATVQELYNYVAGNIKLPFGHWTLALVFPRRELDVQNGRETLADLGLVPNGVILIVPRSGEIAQETLIRGASNMMLSLIARPLSVVYFMWSYVYSFIFPRPEPPENPEAEPELEPEPEPEPDPEPDSQELERPEQNTAQHFSIRRQARMPTTTVIRDGNIHRLTFGRDDDDDTNTWNGNSTQQM